MAEFGALSIVAFASFFYLLFWLFPKRLQWIALSIGYLLTFTFLSLTHAMVLFFVTAIWIGLIQLALQKSHQATLKHVVTCGILIWLLSAFAVKVFDGLAWDIPTVMGLSLISFMGLSLLIDIKRRVLTAPPRLFDLLKYFCFFPYLFVGPIERFSTMKGQFENGRKFEIPSQMSGLFLIAFGLFKKFVIADALDAMAGNTTHALVGLVGVEVLLFLILTFIQIYCNFSGIIDIVRGYSRLLGFELSENFRQPYLADSVPDIWRRWNITLVSWLRDYIYTPLALKSKNLYLAVFVVMVLIGFWHKVNLNYLYWAIYWTLLYSLAIAWRAGGKSTSFPRWLRTGFTFSLMCLSGIFFQTQSLRDYVTIVKNIFRSTGVSLSQSFERLWSIGVTAEIKPVYSAGVGLSIVTLSVILVVVVESIENRFSDNGKLTRGHLIYYGIGTLGLVLLTAALSSGSGSIPFIYLNY